MATLKAKHWVRLNGQEKTPNDLQVAAFNTMEWPKKNDHLQTKAVMQHDQPRSVSGPAHEIGSAAVTVTMPELLRSSSPRVTVQVASQSAGSSRRKGIAYKLQLPKAINGTRINKDTAPPPPIARAENHNGEYNGNAEQKMVCKHCDVKLPTNVLYLKHMGLHCFGEPLTCNLCGKVTNNKSSFLTHIVKIHGF